MEEIGNEIGVNNKPKLFAFESKDISRFFQKMRLKSDGEPKRRHPKLGETPSPPFFNQLEER